MFHKNVVVIDDVGDFFEELSDVFHDDLEIIIKCINSDSESLKQFLKRLRDYKCRQKKLRCRRP